MPSMPTRLPQSVHAFGRDLLYDLRYALRQLRNAPGFAATAILTLALGLGAATAMLAVVDSVLIRALALPHPDRIVNLDWLVHGRPSQFAYEDVQAVKSRVSSLAAITAYDALPAPVETRDGTRVVLQNTVSPGFFAVAGAHARLGRVMTDADAHAPVVVVSDEFWRTELHADPHAIGSTIKVGGHPTTIIGVMPPEFAFPNAQKGEQVYLPLVVNAKGEDQHGFTSVDVAARLKPGVTMAAALAEAQAVYAHLSRAGGKDRAELVMSAYREQVTHDEQPAIYALMGACALLLLIACANSANLQIARGVARTGEMSVRAALGAGRARLLQQIVTESVTVSLLGAALALGIAYAAVHCAQRAYGLRFARFDELALHPGVFAGCTLLAVATGVLAALAPAWNAIRSAGGLPFSPSMRVTRRSRLSSSLVALEVALTCVLLFTGGLFLRTFRALEQAPLGFDPRHVTEITLMPVNPQEDAAALVQTYDRLLDRLSSLPGVLAATTQTSLPFSNFTLSMTSDFKLPGHAPEKDNVTGLSLVSAGYNRTFDVPARQGRGLLPSDHAGTQPVCLVNEAFVRRFLSGGRAVGQTLEFPKNTKEAVDTRFVKEPLLIVGVLPDEVGGRNLGERPGPMLFMDYRQFSLASPQSRFMFGIAPQFAVRSSLPEATLEREIRGALKESAPDMAEMQITPIEGAIADSLATQRLALRLAAGFGLVALLLASVGIYGVLAYSVAQRTREIGIRMALGSTRAGALRLVAGQAAVMAAAGLAVGFAAAWPAGRAVRSFLFGVPPFDPLTLGLAGLLLLLVCACAAAIPAYRATQVDPMEALRTE